MAQLAFARKPTKFPARECSNCHKWYHAKRKACPECGAANEAVVATPTERPRRVKRRRVVNRLPQPQEPIEAAIEFVTHAGSVEAARQALEMIDRIQGLKGSET